MINTISGALDVVDNETFAKIQLINDGVILEDNNLLNKLIERGYLFESEEEEKSLLLKYYSYYKERIENGQIREYMICPTMACNLRCVYCFQKDLHTNTNMMTLDCLQNIFKKIREDIKESEDRPIRLTLFGGEPLLKNNKEFVNIVLNFCLEVGVEILIVTNGTTLDAYIDDFSLFKKTNKLSIQVTLDGNRELHDKRRLRADGSGTFGEIIENIDKLVQKDISTIIRVNVDKENIKQIDCIRQIFIDKKWNENNNFRAYISPVLDFSLQSDSVLTEADLLKILIKEYPKILDGTDVIREVVSNNIPFVQEFFNFKNNRKPWRMGYCEATSGQTLVFCPDGSIVTCLNLAGKGVQIIGEVESDSIHMYPEEAEKWFDRSIFSIEKCKKCKYALLCGGGCPVIALEKNHDINSPVCINIEKIVEIYIDYIKNRIISLNK